MLASAGLLVLLWLGITHVESGQLQTADLVRLLLYAMLLTQPISGLTNVYGQVQHTRGAADRLQAFFAEHAEPADTTGRLAYSLESVLVSLALLLSTLSVKSGAVFPTPGA